MSLAMTMIRVVDAFTDRPYSGNPAAVCILSKPADETWMKSLAAEMNLSETAFLHPIEGGYSLRWLTPTVEVKLCGHATLASAFVLWETGLLKHDEIARFHTLSGWLTCRHNGHWIDMDFPATVCEPVDIPAGLAEALGCKVLWCGSNGMDYLLEVADERTLRFLSPDLAMVATLPVRGIIVTCRSDTHQFDFVSRFFAPAAGVDEDPVTGSAHCALAPYWGAKLGKDQLQGFQASQRGGCVRMQLLRDRVILSGQAVMMSRVEMFH